MRKPHYEFVTPNIFCQVTRVRRLLNPQRRPALPVDSPRAACVSSFFRGGGWSCNDKWQPLPSCPARTGDARRRTTLQHGARIALTYSRGNYAQQTPSEARVRAYAVRQRARRVAACSLTQRQRRVGALQDGDGQATAHVSKRDRASHAAVPEDDGARHVPAIQLRAGPRRKAKRIRRRGARPLKRGEPALLDKTPA